jgi:hypothetical protein
MPSDASIKLTSRLVSPAEKVAVLGAEAARTGSEYSNESIISLLKAVSVVIVNVSRCPSTTERFSDDTEILIAGDLPKGKIEPPHPDRVHAKKIKKIEDKKRSFTFYLSVIIEFD